MRVLITGANGLLGGYLIKDFLAAGHEVVGTSRGEYRDFDKVPSTPGSFIYNEADLTDGHAMNTLITELRADLIIHSGAMTQVDQCERNPINCWNTNVTSTRFIIEAAHLAGSALLFVSTDFVFNGEKGMYSEDDLPAPVNYYGCSKLAAEKAIMQSNLRWSIARTVLVYGNTIGGTRNHFLAWVKNELSQGKKIRVVNDQVRTPTYAGDLSAGILTMAEEAAKGIFHISGKDILTPYDMALQTAQYFNLDTSLIQQVDAKSFSEAAKRPPKTGFNIGKARSCLHYEPLTFSEGLAKVFAKA